MFKFKFSSGISKKKKYMLDKLTYIIFDILESYREVFELSNESKKIQNSKTKDFNKLDDKQIELLKKYDSAYINFTIKVTNFLENIVNNAYSVKNDCED